MTTAETPGGPDRPDGRDQARTVWYPIGEGVLGGLLLALLALAVWYLIPVGPPTPTERWLMVIASAAASGIINGVWRPRRRQRSHQAASENE